MQCMSVTLVLRSSQRSEPTSAQCKACSDNYIMSSVLGVEPVGAVLSF